MNPALIALVTTLAVTQQAPPGDSLRLRGEYLAAERTYLAVIQDPASTPEPVGLALCGLAMLYLETNRPADAEQVARRAVALEGERRGERSPEAAYALGLLGSALSRLQRHDEAEQTLRRAVRLSSDALGGKHLQTTRLRANLAVVLVARGLLSKAEPLLRDAEAGLRIELGDSHMEVAVLRHNLGVLYLQQKRLALAESELTSALSAWERLFGVRSPYFIQTANLLVRTRCLAGETRSASRLLALIFPVARELLGAGHPETARVQFNRAELEFLRGDVLSAERSAREAIEALKEYLPTARAEFLSGLSFYRTVLKRKGDPAGAKRIARWSRHIRNTPTSAPVSAYIQQSCGSSL